MQFVWTIEAQKQLAALDYPLQKRIAEKMRWFASQKDPNGWVGKPCSVRLDTDAKIRRY